MENRNKMKIRKLALFIPFLVACSSPVNEHPLPKPTSTPTPTSTKEQSYNVLFIGNSFTHYNDLEVVSQNVGQDIGLDITCDRVATSAFHLYEHADATNPTGQLVEEKLKNNTYTHVIIQEHSTYPVSNYQGFLNGATALVNKIRTYQKYATIRLYQTWGFENMVGNYGNTIPECENALCEAYKKVGKALNINIHYVGKAFTKSYLDNPDINIYYSEDNKHPSFAGTYLSALIHILSLSGKKLDNLSYRGVEGSSNQYGETYLTSEVAEKLKSTATYIYQNYGINY